MDCISHLPDDLLLQILSLNKTKDVMATSLLSKRWRSLWTLVPGLKYDDSNHNGDYKLFTQFVYRSFLSNKASVLEHLHLSLGLDCPSVDIGILINLAVNRHLCELHIDIRSSNNTSERVQRLTLISCVSLDVPSHVRLSSLKTLSLNAVTYANKTSLQRLLSGCPILEVLSVKNVFERSPMDVTVAVPSLQRLHMSHITPGTRGTYVLNVPSLKYLDITDWASCNFRQIENMPELVTARVSFCADTSTHDFLKALTSVCRLTPMLQLTEVVNPSGVIFNQLVHLDLNTFAEGWWDLLTCMLQDSPKLRFLKLTDNFYIGKDIPTGWKPPSSVPECLLHSLEAFEWFGYRGKQQNREMAAYVLKNSICLKTATFSPESTRLGKKNRMLKGLASIITASASVQILCG